MKMLTIHLPEPLLASIEAESQNRRISRSQVVRERLERTRRRVTGLEDIVDLIGSVDGLPNDLSMRADEYLRLTGYVVTEVIEARLDAPAGKNTRRNVLEPAVLVEAHQ